MKSFVIKLLLRVHSLSYKTAGFLAAGLEKNNLHPKHRIMNYHKFFVDNISEGVNVLDIGCGNGALTYDIAKKAKKVVGIDLSEENISKARRIYSRENIVYIHGNALTDLRDEKFDVIVMSNVLEHIKERVDFLKSLKEKAPKFLIRVPLIDRDWITLYKKELGLDYRLDNGHFIEYTLESFKNELNDARLQLSSYRMQFGEVWAVATSGVQK